jgi:The GLUG motif.
VTDTIWADSSGAQQSTLSFTADEFASSNVNLAGLACKNSDGTSLALSATFAATTTAYSLSTAFSGTAVSIVATGVVGSQNLVCKLNGTTQAWTSIDGSTYVFTASSIQLISGTNTFTITVTAPDKTTTKTYSVTVVCGAAGITIANPATSYSSMGFASSASIAQGEAFSLTSSNTTFSSIASGWSWYLNGTLDATQTGPSYSLTSSQTTAMLGDYQLAYTVKSGDVVYSGSAKLSIKKTLLSSANLASLLTTCLAGSFTLDQDIDLSASSWTPIGSSATPFTGTIDGNGHTITVSIPASSTGYQGFIACLGAAGVVKNLNLNVVFSSAAAMDINGGLVAYNYGTIEHCSVSGTVTNALNGYTGGIAGVNAGIVNECYNTATVTSTWYAGGLVGKNKGTIKNSYARCTVTCNGTAQEDGVLVGLNEGGTITNCYAVGSVALASAYYGKIVGAHSSGTISGCYYDNSSGVASSADVTYATGYATAAMKSSANYSGWDFTTIWGIDTSTPINNGYPYLRYFGTGTVTP